MKNKDMNPLNMHSELSQLLLKIPAHYQFAINMGNVNNM